MFEKLKKTKMWRKLKNTKVNKAAVLTVFVLVAALAVIISVTVASNRSKKKPPELPTDDSKTQTTENNTPSSETTKNNTDTTPTTNPPADSTIATVDDKIPSFVLPVTGKLSKGHDASQQVYSNTMSDYRTHLGIDIVTEEKAPVYAAADGTVQKIWDDPLMGYRIAIKHSGDSCTIYKNLSKELPEGISENAKVRSGQLIATVGDSAMIEIAEEPHIHFEMTVAGLSVDPIKYLSESAVKALGIDSSYEN